MLNTLSTPVADHKPASVRRVSKLYHQLPSQHVNAPGYQALLHHSAAGTSKIRVAAASLRPQLVSPSGVQRLGRLQTRRCRRGSVVVDLLARTSIYPPIRAQQAHMKSIVERHRAGCGGRWRVKG